MGPVTGCRRAHEPNSWLTFAYDSPSSFAIAWYVSPLARSATISLRSTTVATRPHRNLYRALVQRLGEIAIGPKDVSVVILEPGLESWGVRGGRSAADVDLGFSLDV